VQLHKGTPRALQGTHSVPCNLPRTSNARWGSSGRTCAARQALHRWHSMAVWGPTLVRLAGYLPDGYFAALTGVFIGVPTWVDRTPPSSNRAAVRAAWMATRWALQRSLAHTAAWLVWCGTIVYSRGTHRVLKEYCITRTLRRRVRVRCRGQQRVPGGLRADRDRGGVPHRRRRRGQDPGVAFRGDQLLLTAGMLLHYQQQLCVLECPRRRRRRSFLPV
jgi:hypothetical protein